MTRVIREIEGAWEEVRAHEAELAGKRVKLQVLDEVGIQAPENRPRSTTAALLQHTPGWEGEDFEDCLASVYRTRQP